MNASATNNTIIVILYIAIFAGFYFFLIRPQSKKKKNEEKMRKSAQVGDEITTIGGIVGRVVGVKEDDSLIIETGSDRAKMRVRRWAIGSIDNTHEEAE
ncbi:preprotein translocase subunit YajC [Caproiciproducens galactitolivorans]|uniref:Preprotein translocase subunit YajC n=1 Tax=Caproiciproducens galactitolivorans TaxID=642589 RepID=A0ABT4BR26_9FIRM|nr:preprotein translocase subunit YajC [Caproiciproducens galactitolivorans]MCY1713249.1 preprotein translocase subunit YajC [Caproiciproducens galactitolivorans]